METLKKAILVFKSSVAYPQKSLKEKKIQGPHHESPCIFIVQSNCLPLVFVAGLAKKSEHVLLVCLNTGLVERIYGEEIT